LCPGGDSSIDINKFLKAFAKCSLKVHREEEIANKVKYNWKIGRILEIRNALSTKKLSI